MGKSAAKHKLRDAEDVLQKSGRALRHHPDEKLPQIGRAASDAAGDIRDARSNARSHRRSKKRFTYASGGFAQPLCCGTDRNKQ